MDAGRCERWRCFLSRRRCFRSLCTQASTHESHVRISPSCSRHRARADIPNLNQCVWTSSMAEYSFAIQDFFELLFNKKCMSSCWTAQQGWGHILAYNNTRRTTPSIQPRIATSNTFCICKPLQILDDHRKKLIFYDKKENTPPIGVSSYTSIRTFLLLHAKCILYIII